MDAQDRPEGSRQTIAARLTPARLIGLQGRLARPFWGVMGLWSALCGALASNRFRWDGGDLLALALVLLLVDLAWGSLWDLIVGTDWRHLLGAGRSPVRPASLAALPYTQPDSPAGRLFRRGNRLGGWWRETFWPEAGPVLLGSLVATALTIVLTVFLPERVRPLNAALAVLMGLGVVRRWRGRLPLAGQALVLVGLSWLAGQMAFAELSWPSAALALAYSAAAWGVQRVMQSESHGLWLLNGGQVIAAVLLAALRQPLAAGATGLLLLAQVALQPSLRWGNDPVRAMRRTWPWLMAAMLVAALAVP